VDSILVSCSSLLGITEFRPNPGPVSEKGIPGTNFMPPIFVWIIRMTVPVIIPLHGAVAVTRRWVRNQFGILADVPVDADEIPRFLVDPALFASVGVSCPSVAQILCPAVSLVIVQFH